MTEKFNELPGWAFEVEEVSAGVYEVEGRDSAGRRVSVRGTDPDALLEEARDAAKCCSESHL